jgi:pimeloyl-ACP methyl ester carboxylesterase
VPTSYRGERPLSLLVTVHGANRTAEKYRDLFVDFSEANDCVVLAPLFPMSTADLTSVHNLKEIEFDGTRFDQALLDMVDEVAEGWGLDAQRFGLFGFSAGGQFAHRFLMLHPERLAAVSVGAPGRLTRPDQAIPWPDGLGGVAERFGITPDLAALEGVTVQTVVGGSDTELSATAGRLDQQPAVARTRVDNAKLLYEDLIALGVDAEFALVPGVEHVTELVAPAVKEFFLRRFIRSRD